MLEHEAEEKAYKYEKKYSEDFKLAEIERWICLQ